MQYLSGVFMASSAIELDARPSAMQRHGEARRAVLLRLFLALSIQATPWIGRENVLAQEVVEAARPAIRSPGELVEVLRAAAVRPGADIRIETALIATWGEPVTSWALDLARDATRPTWARQLAIAVLSYARPVNAIPVLRGIIDRGPAADDAWADALSALARFTDPELAPYWRERLRAPIPDVRLQAMYGLSMTGTADDIPLVTGLDPHGPPWLAEMREQAVRRLGMPIEARDTGLFAGPRGSRGAFVPSASWLAQVRPYLCARRGLCQ